MSEHSHPLRERLRAIIFGHEKGAAQTFDVVLILAILTSVTVVMLDSIREVSLRYHDVLYVAEWLFTILFTVEYLLRLWVAEDARRYARSFFGVVDLVAIIPTYLAVLAPGTQFLIVLRIFRVLRVFRILKLTTYLGEAAVLARAVRASRHKILVFVFFVLTTVVVVGALMYLVEGPQSGFTSIPRGVYWAIVTLTTVGYGDIVPRTPVGQGLASLIMIMGYGVIAVPTGIVTVELQRAGAERPAPGVVALPERCGECGRGPHAGDSVFCRLCGARLRRD